MKISEGKTFSDCNFPWKALRHDSKNVISMLSEFSYLNDFFFSDFSAAMWFPNSKHNERVQQCYIYEKLHLPSIKNV